ncbi:unnamed protein product [Owenia fusiformis]|uniref:Maleylacetoacetate isomerase n=1 Tax=Owenia fusiformis TaxID=6347 RepID=A0A8J1U5K1_OWEFU|nr:unnamed protein product [Owenia fusiformis]
MAMGTKAKPILYSYFRSSCSYRVRIALALKGVEYEYRAVNLVKDGGQQHFDEYKQLNPMEMVPSFVVDGQALTQSVPIMEYIEEVYPQKPSLLPKDPLVRAQVRAVSEIINSGIQPIQNLPVLQYVGDEKKMEWGRYWIDKGFKGLEKQLQQTAGEFCVGDEVSMADACLVPQVFNANRFKVDMSQFPTINKIHQNCLNLEAFKAAGPTMQPDCPDDLK